MMAKTHAVFGLACGIALMHPTTVSLSFAVIGSVLPDVDHKNSLLGHFLPFHWIFRHRGFTHSLAALMIIASLTPFIAPEIIHGLTIGYASHIAVDLLNDRGEQLLWPSRKTYCLGLFRTGGIGEYVVIALAGLVIYLSGGVTL